MSHGEDWDFSFTWSIQNFLSRSYKIDDKIVSPEFFVEFLNRYKWQLEIYPAGKKAGSENHVACFLKHIKDNAFVENRMFNCEIRMMNGKHENLKSMSISINENLNFESIGSNSFIEIEKLRDGLRNCSEDTVIIRCSIKDKNIKKKCVDSGRTRLKAERYSCELNVRALLYYQVTAMRQVFCLDNTLYEIDISMENEAMVIKICKMTKNISPARQITGKITLLNAKGNETLSKTETHSYDSEDDGEIWDFPSLLTKKELQDNFAIYVNNGNIIFLCEFFVHKSIATEIDSSNTRKNISNFNGLINLSHDFRNLLVSKKNSDVTLRVDSEIKFQAHKNVLVSRSPVFSAMFERETLENQTGIIDIQDVDSNTLESFLEYLYTGVVSDINAELASKMLVVADKYQVPSLIEECAHFLKSSLTADKVCEILVCSDMVGHKHLKTACVDFIAERVTEVFSINEYYDCIQECPTLYAEILTYLGKHFETLKHTLTLNFDLTVTANKFHSKINKCEESSDLYYYTADGQIVKEISNPENTPIIPREDTIPKPFQNSFDSLLDDLNLLLTKNEFCDVNLKINGKEFPAHKCILSARSSVFCTMFQSHMKEKETGVVDIEDIDADTFERFLKYLYLGKLDKLTEETAIPLYSAADKYHVTSLKKECSSYILDHLSEENVCDILILSDMHQDEELKNAAQKTFCIYSKNILLSKDWATVLQERPKLAIETLQKMAVNMK